MSPLTRPVRQSSAVTQCDLCLVLLNATPQICLVFPQAPNSSESPGTSRTEHSDLLEEEEDERSDIKVKLKLVTRVLERGTNLHMNDGNVFIPHPIGSH